MTTQEQGLPIEETRLVVPEDDSFYHHGRTQSPWWNESAWFGFMIPERKINAYFYMWHRPNMRMTSAGVALWDPYGEDTHNCLYYDWYHMNSLREDSDMFNYELANGMKCTLLEPLYKYHLEYTSKACDIDLIWQGVQHPQDLHFPRSKGFEHFGGFHYEQLGHVTGTVRLEDEQVPVDCHHVRDHSWGIRERHRRHPGGGLEMGWVSENTNFCITFVRPDPLAPLMDVSVDGPGYGQMTKDGKLGHAVSGERRIVERRADGVPMRFEIDLKDEDGREMHAVGKMENNLNWDSLWFVHWGLVSWTIDGEEGWGETQDWWDQDQLRAHRRKVLKESGAAFGA